MGDRQIIHLVNRLSLGLINGQINQIKNTGMAGYINSQLNPNSLAIPATLTQELQPLDTLPWRPGKLVREQNREVNEAQKLGLGQPQLAQVRRQFQQRVINQIRRARMIRALHSPRQLEEVMVDFWFNHFNVFGLQGLSRIWIGSYEEHAIRPHVWGKFRTLLGATARHPAMLFYLDNWQNTAPNSPGATGRFKGLNENYARELLELHTLGVEGGYTQNDVMELARILTGWGLPKPSDRPRNQEGFYFDETRHDFNDKILLGRTIKGRGIEEVEEALDILASHPATAKHIGYKLAQAFVADEPPSSLVKALGDRFIETQGDITEVLKTLFNSTEFWEENHYNSKFKNPYRYITSVMRAVGEVTNYDPINGILNQLGMPLYGCPSPDGYKNTQQAWLNPDTMVRRSSLAVPLAGGLLHKGNPVDVKQLEETLGVLLSAQTRQILAESPPNLQGAIFLGSPEFMRY
ncbi:MULTISPECIES: DUF1800 domain-containing protein [Oscillatoriales]|mgnify:CR=1 FL=1|jgi:uncharacterized protein (DUF1800 family)|uniref:DUF1800 domain-containing protein n=1 Tax=Limnospira platensis NIES-46 TaxID=1236695 RepID=A0A5M3T6Q2_LIMPL|nr:MULTISPECIES: DUF1800 domain-containing protein [Arthrospira]MDF2211780.1 DUF1800 domain-containing protein [Arthrospira platensis NCB002]MDT9182268.1 DUF1800 domain-containing protein [Limnospira sp. PMC 289.06]MDT9294400.1 DUF1800 domain-containing protein [Arthrospira platensis PCC 7345]BAI88171.1 hypothetical protein NIES39_A03320 [Arthrospira platensis NIES-39]TVU53174.1 MAG: DUF1800 domain-containing protein [Arthrospira sp. PLM2.Bin9]